MIKEEKILQFKFKGDRDYIHGTDIFNKIKELTRSTLINLDLKFNGLSRKQLILNLNGTDSAARANLWLTTTTAPETHYQFVESEIELTDRYDYDENLIIEKCQLTKNPATIKLSAKSPYTFIENVVAMQKQMLQCEFGKLKGKWLFTRIALDTFPADESLPKVVLVKNFNFKLVQSDIFIEDKKIGTIYFSLTTE